jgi:hypothetical protein
LSGPAAGRDEKRRFIRLKGKLFMPNPSLILSVAASFLLAGTVLTAGEPATATNLADRAQIAAQRVLRLAPGPGNPRNSEGDFIVLKDGRLRFIYTRFTGGAGDHARADLASRESTDGGLTWTATDRIEIRNEGDWNIMSVSLLRLHRGRIALFYLRKNSAQDCRPVLRYSDDEANSWSAPTECITDEIGYYVLNNDRVIQLAGGRLVAPVAQHARVGEKSLRAGVVVCYLSDDEGKTWRRSKSTLSADAEGMRINLMEPGVVELGDGRLLMVLRTKLGCQYQSWSKDGGENWTIPAPSALFSPESPATIKIIPGTTKLLAVWNDHRGQPEAYRVATPPRRTPLALAVSSDGGVTWGPSKTIESDPASGYCYIAMEFVGRRVLLGYCAHPSRYGLETTQITAVEFDQIER